MFVVRCLRCCLGNLGSLGVYLLEVLWLLLLPVGWLEVRKLGGLVGSLVDLVGTYEGLCVFIHVGAGWQRLCFGKMIML